MIGSPYWLDLPFELRLVIAELSPEACYTAWRYDPQFRRGFNPRQWLELFITYAPGETRVLGMLHSIYDSPAMIWQEGLHLVRAWYDRGVLHRVGGPALISQHAAIGLAPPAPGPDRGVEWLDSCMSSGNMGVIGTAIIKYDTHLYCQNGVPHRDDGPVCAVFDREYYADHGKMSAMVHPRFDLIR